jgi:fused signal recognition particle receptor
VETPALTEEAPVVEPEPAVSEPPEQPAVVEPLAEEVIAEPVVAEAVAEQPVEGSLLPAAGDGSARRGRAVKR